MKLLNKALSLFLGLQLLVCTAGAGAFQISYSPNLDGSNGTLSGHEDISKLGSLTLPRGRVTFNEHEVEITIIPEWQFDRLPVLTGRLLRTQVTTQGQQTITRGIAYFQDGDWMPYINNPGAQETVTTSSGIISGKITDLTDSDLEITQSDANRQRIPFSSIQDIQSPRAYTFTIWGVSSATVAPGQSFQAQTSRLSMQPTARIFHLAALKHDPVMQGDGDISGTKLTLLWAFLTTTELAQFVPEIAIANRYGHMYRVAQEQQFQTQVTAPLISGPQAVAPLPF